MASVQCLHMTTQIMKKCGRSIYSCAAQTLKAISIRPMRFVEHIHTYIGRNVVEVGGEKQGSKTSVSVWDQETYFMYWAWNEVWEGKRVKWDDWMFDGVVFCFVWKSIPTKPECFQFLYPLLCIILYQQHVLLIKVNCRTFSPETVHIKQNWR